MAELVLLALIIGVWFFGLKTTLPTITSTWPDPFSVANPQVATVIRINAADKTTQAQQLQVQETPTAKSAAPTPHKMAASSQINASAPQATRIAAPYATPSQSLEAVNVATRNALVNILCTSHSGQTSVSGSGVIIDPRGIILTNAHVAQYVLLSQDSRVNLQCIIRGGAPAQAAWSAVVLYIPPAWVREHAPDITREHPTGTGEHDYALLRFVPSPSTAPLLAFPFLAPDVREGIAFINDEVLTASYPAEFAGGIDTLGNLYPASSASAVRQLLTFGNETIDLISIGNVIEAQSGSSGGAVVNAWGRLVGIITTTSGGATTAQRDLRALTLSYINRDLEAQTGLGLSGVLNRDLDAAQNDFDNTYRQPLTEQLIAQLKRQ